MLFNSKTLVSLIALLIQPVEAQLPRKRRSLETKRCPWNEAQEAYSKEDCKKEESDDVVIQTSDTYVGCVEMFHKEATTSTVRVWVRPADDINKDTLGKYKNWTIEGICKNKKGHPEKYILKPAETTTAAPQVAETTTAAPQVAETTTAAPQGEECRWNTNYIALSRKECDFKNQGLVPGNKLIQGGIPQHTLRGFGFLNPFASLGCVLLKDEEKNDARGRYIWVEPLEKTLPTRGNELILKFVADPKYSLSSACKQKDSGEEKLYSLRDAVNCGGDNGGVEAANCSECPENGCGNQCKFSTEVGLCIFKRN